MGKEMEVPVKIIKKGWEGLSLITHQTLSLAEWMLGVWADLQPEDIGGFRGRLKSVIHLRELKKLQRRSNPNY